MSDLLKVAGKTNEGLAKAFAVENNRIIRTIDSARMAQVISEPTLLNIPTYDGSNQPVHPAVVHINGGWNGYKFWMAFTPYPNGDEKYENPSIVASNDGVNFEVPEGLTNPLAPYPGLANSWNRDPQLIFAQDENGGNGRMYLYWTRNGVSPIAQRIYSDDGINWSSPEGSDLDLWGIVRNSATDWECYTKNGEGFRRWVSSDGLTWRRDVYKIPSNLNGEIWHHSIYKDAGGYNFLASCYPSNMTIAHLSLYFGFSRDGYDVVFDSTPLLMAKPGTWYSGKIYQSVFVPMDDTTYRVYMSASSADGTWHTGYFDIRISNQDRAFHAVRKPRPETVERYLLYKTEVRDTSNILIEVPELSEYENKVLVVHSTLKAGETEVKPYLWVYQNMRNDFTGSEDILIYGESTTDKTRFSIPYGAYNSCLVTKEHLSALEYMLPHESGFRIYCPTAPDSGALTIMIKAWA